MFTGLIDKGCFPIDSIERTVELFKKQLTAGTEPNLALLSIVVGAIENNLTGARSVSSDKESSVHLNKLVKVGFPELTVSEVGNLYDKFVTVIKNAVDPKAGIKSNYATREIIKRVSDVIWNSLTRSYYKDRAHLQSIFSYLSGKKLDCFGVAFAVVAGCQVLGYSDVHLALSEDHAWVVFGKNGIDTAEVTWHGKGNEDKRGQPIGTGVLSRSWLYVAGHPVICTRSMEVAALVSSINPSLTSTTDVYEVALMQQHLLWLLYDQGHLGAYPMALGNLGELEEASRYNDGKYRPDCSELFLEAIKSAQNNYSNRHVYPYTYQGAYFYRNKMYKEAFGSWADAGDVIRLYNYSRDDEEIYKEFLEIANELIPQIMKAESSGHSARSILKDPQCFAHLLRFYDGICKWEEESQTPILHIGWAKPLVNTISKFDADVRAQVIVLCCEEDDIPDNPNVASLIPEEEKHNIVTSNEDSKKFEEGGTKESNNIRPESKKENELSVRSIESPGQSATVSDTTKIFNIKTQDVKPDDLKVSPSISRSAFESHSKPQQRELGEELEAAVNSHPTTKLYSHKMKGLKNLLLAEKLNTHAISLHLTAQSQVFINKKSRTSGEAVEQSVHCSTRPKRVRRE